jgi:hypothetical protein
MTILDVVVTNFLVGQCFVGLGQLNKTLVESFNSLILRGIWTNFVRVIDKGKALIMPRDSFFIGALKIQPSQLMPSII